MTIKIAKKVKKKWRHHLYLVLRPCTPKGKYIGSMIHLLLIVRLLLIHSSILFFQFWWCLKKTILLEFIFLKQNCNFGDQKPKKKKILNSRFLKFNLASFGAFCLRFASKPCILEANECWPFFGKESRDMSSLKRRFLNNVSTDFAEILCECAKLMLY